MAVTPLWLWDITDVDDRLFRYAHTYIERLYGYPYKVAWWLVPWGYPGQYVTD